jgi:hypothetical protein
MKKSKNKFISLTSSSLLCYLALLLVSNSAFAIRNNLGEVIETKINATDPSSFGPPLVDNKLESGCCKSIVSQVSLGPSFSSEIPTQAKSFAKMVDDEGGIVRGQLQTGLNNYDVDLYSYWLGGFEKEADDATFEFNITKAFLQLQNDGPKLENASADFVFSVQLDQEEVFNHKAAISGKSRSDLGIETYDIDYNDGPMTGIYKEFDVFDGPNPITPSGKITAAELEFHPYTGSVDLSEIAVGETFIIEYVLEMSVEGVGGETWSTARFSDPGDFESGGVTTTITGLTPVPSAIPVPCRCMAVCFRFTGAAWHQPPSSELITPFPHLQARVDFVHLFFYRAVRLSFPCSESLPLN